MIAVDYGYLNKPDNFTLQSMCTITNILIY